MFIDRLAFRFFGDLTKPYLGYFDEMNRDMRRALMPQSVHEYLCSILFYSLLAFAASVLVGSIIISLIFPSVLFSYTLAILFSLIAGGTVFALGYYYPSLKAQNIKAEIDRSLPFAVFFMATTAASGVNPVEIFKTLSVRGGTIGKEASRIYSNVVNMGMSISDSLQKAATKTPSNSFADLLWGLSAVITSGGDVQDYLTGKTRTYMQQYHRALNDYAKQISLYTEIYITLIIVGTLFFIVLTAMISPLGGMNMLLLQTFLVFILTPFVSAGFLVLLKGISPTG